MGKRFGMDKFKIDRRIVIFTSEFLATYILLFLGCMGCVSGIQGGPIPHEQISFTFGLAILISVQCFAHISGSHLNPVVTLASAILGKTPWVMAPVYMFGQMIGALAGFASLMLLTPAQYLGNYMTDGVLVPGICSPQANKALSSFQAVAVEFIVTSFLILVCCAVWDRKNANHHDSVSVRFGLAVTALALAAGPYSGANMNPARSFAPALLNGNWDYHWVYWVGPTFGTVFTTYLYKIVFDAPDEEEDPQEDLPLN